MSKFPATVIEAPGKGKKKEKKEKALVELSDKLHSYHSAFSAPANSYSCSILLSCNNHAVIPMITEMAEFCVHLERFYKAVDIGKAIPEANTYYKQFTLKLKEILDALLLDLKFYSKEYDFDIDIKDCIARFNSVKNEMSLKLKNADEKLKLVTGK